MSVSIDCNDGAHRACAECCCECHNLPTFDELVHGNGTDAHRGPARHAAQAHGIERLMTAPATGVALTALASLTVAIVTVTLVAVITQ